MEAARKFESEPRRSEDRLARLTALERLQEDSQEFDVAADIVASEAARKIPHLVRVSDQANRSHLPPEQQERIKQELLAQEEDAAALEFLVTDTAREVVAKFHRAEGGFNDRGEFIPQLGTFELLVAALDGDEEAYEYLGEDSGIQEWLDYWRGDPGMR